MTEKPKKQKNWLFYLVIVLLVVAVIYMMNNQPSGKSITYSEFQDKVVAGEVTHVKTVGNTVYIRIKDSKITEANFIKGKKGDFTTTFINSQELIEFMNDYNNGQLTSQNGVAPTEKVVVSYNLQGESLLSQLLPYLSIGAVIIVAIIIVRTIAETSSKNMAFGKVEQEMLKEVK